MPPKSKASTSITKCIKVGEILIDENKKIVLLCVNCFEDFKNVQELCKHLINCEPAKQIFRNSKEEKDSSKSVFNFECDTSNFLRKVHQKTRELLIYGVKEKPAESNISDIEAEILDPRWYTDSTESSPIRTHKKNNAIYNNLIEEVTPFVQFKENVKSLSTPKPVKQFKPQQQTSAAVRSVPPKTVATTAPRLTATSAPKNPAINQINKQTIQKNVAAPQGKLAVTSASTLKRKITTSEVISPVAATAKPQFAVQTAIKRARTAAESSPVIQQRPMPRDSIPKTTLNSAIIGLQTQTLNIAPQTSTHRPSAPPKSTTNPIPTQKPQTNAINQLVRRVMPKLITGPTLQTVPIAAAPQRPPPTATAATNNNKRTVDILNKLQNLGLKIQRTNPAPTNLPAPTEKDTAALEIIRKLQSKGMEVKRLPKPSSNSARTLPTPKLSPVKQTATVVGPVPKHYVVRKCN